MTNESTTVQEVKVAESVALRVMRLMASGDPANPGKMNPQMEFIEQHLQDVHGKSLNDFAGIKLEITLVPPQQATDD